MSPAYMLVLITGVLLTASSLIVFADSGPVLAGLALLVVGLSLIILGAVGLGRGLLPPYRPGITGEEGATYPARLEGNWIPTSRGGCGWSNGFWPFRTT
ncbi:hypothetical protein [Arthrobacter sp. TMN-50]